MPKKLTDRPIKHGLLRVALRFPIFLYRARLGWLLGNRFLLLTHRGRKSGLPQQTVLEVVRHDKSSSTFIIASGWGEEADWYRNLQHTPDVLVTSGKQTFAAKANTLTPEEAEREVRKYAKRHPFAFRKLAGHIIGQSLHGTPDDYRLFAHAIPFVALQPKGFQESQ